MPANAKPKSAAARRALGRGLAALLPTPPATPVPSALPDERRLGFRLLPIEQVEPNRDQPRKTFLQAPLGELAASIKAQGVLQPIVVRRRGKGSFELVAGERRWRAAQLAGLQEIPALVKELSDVRAMQVALIENIQREDLDPLEEALAYQRLLAEHALRQEDLAAAVGKSRTAITHSLRLLRLPEELLGMVADGKLSPGHARALLQLPKNSQRLQVAAEVLRHSWSVRETEQRAREMGRAFLRQAAKQQASKTEPPSGTAGARDLVERLQRALGTRVQLIATPGKSKPQAGTLQLQFASYEQLDHLTEKLLA